MTERAEYRDYEIDLGGYMAIVRTFWWKVALISAVSGVVALLVLLQWRDMYQATAVIVPAAEDEMPAPTNALGAFASLQLAIGSPTRIEDLETLFRSNNLAVRVFQKHQYWHLLYPDRFDPASGTLLPSLLDRLLRGQEPGPPGPWDAIRAARKRLTVVGNRKAGTLTLSFEAPAPEGAADIVRRFLDEGKSRLQEDAFERASLNKKFVEGQIGRTLDPPTRDRLYMLYSKEVEREMMAMNRGQFGFRVVDAPMPPDRKSGPHRAVIVLLVMVLFSLLSTLIFGRRAGTKTLRRDSTETGA